MAGANITLLNGSDGLGEIASGLVTQGLAIYESVRAGIGVNGNGELEGPAARQ